MERAVDADILIVNKTPLTREHFEALPNLKLVCVAATGYDKIDIAAARQHGIHVCNCAGYSQSGCSQMAVALILEVATASEITHGVTVKVIGADRQILLHYQTPFGIGRKNFGYSRFRKYR